MLVAGAISFLASNYKVDGKVGLECVRCALTFAIMFAADRRGSGTGTP